MYPSLSTSSSSNTPSAHDRTTAELIREAMEAYRQRWAERRGSLHDLLPLDLGEVKRPLERGDDLLQEMLG